MLQRRLGTARLADTNAATCVRFRVRHAVARRRVDLRRKHLAEDREPFRVMWRSAGSVRRTRRRGLHQRRLGAQKPSAGRRSRVNGVARPGVNRVPAQRSLVLAWVTREKRTAREDGEDRCDSH